MIAGEIIGGDQLVQRLRDVGPALDRELLTAIQRLSLQLQARVVSEKLSGQVVGVKTGRLRRSITQKVESSAGTVTGIVGTNVQYARAIELGFQGTESVRQHLRRITQAFGRPLKGGPIEVTVRAHSRHVNIPARSFLRSALEEMRPQILATIGESVQKAIAA